MAAEENLIKSEDLVKARELEFTYMFSDSLKKLIEALDGMDVDVLPGVGSLSYFCLRHWV